MHTGDCWNAGKRSKAIAREQVRHALADGIKACPHCRPDNALGILGSSDHVGVTRGGPPSHPSTGSPPRRPPKAACG
ncbi:MULTISPECIES: DUF6233 domain-containing protein [unclassified Streptomyces]|uniref:DUF6233 domain-containing protein n=1 Tax=unclassified Streptomyces TaxID=2593676 RepID=UPI00331C814C